MASPPRALLHNWRLKSSALGMAVLLWAMVQTEPNGGETFSVVPLRLDVADTSWALVGLPDPSVVEVRVDGPAREIIRLARDGVTVRIPVTTVSAPDTLITLRREWVDLGNRPGLSVESLSPSAVRVVFEPAVTRLVPVAPRIEGRVRDHLALARAVGVSPQLVRVRGPESRVLGLDSIALVPFDMDRVTDSGIYTVAVDTAGLEGGAAFPPTATLDVRVEDMVERVLDGIEVQADVAPGQEDVVIDPQTVRLTLSGARTLVTALDSSGLRVWIPPEFLQDMEPGEVRRVRVQVDGVPEFVTAVPAIDMIRVRRATDLEGVGTAERPHP